MNNIRKTCQRFLVLKTSTDDCGDLGCFGDLGNLWLFMYVKFLSYVQGEGYQIEI